MAEETVIVDRYLKAREVLESCGFLVTVQDAAAFKVVPKDYPINRHVWTGVKVDDLQTFANGVKACHDI